MEKEAAVLRPEFVLGRRKSVEKAWRLRQEFLIFAVSRGADLQKKRPENKPSWNRKLEIAEAINFSSATEASVAREQGIDRRAVHQLYTKGVRGLWVNLSEEEKERFPWDSIKSARKPAPKMAMADRIQRSKEKGGNALLIQDALRRGVRTYDKLREITGLSGPQVWKARRTLESWGEEVPRKFSIKTPRQSLDIGRLRKLLENEQTKNSGERLLRKLIPNSLRRLSRLHPDIFTSTAKVLARAGLHVQSGSKDFKRAQSLIKESGFFIRRIPSKVKGKTEAYYSILLKQDEPDIIILLNSDSEMIKHRGNPVTRLWGEKDDSEFLPSHSDLVKSGKFGRLGPLTKQIAGIRFGLQGNIWVSVRIIFAGCPVPLYSYVSGTRSVYYYPKSQESEVLDFLARKYGLPDAPKKA